MNETRDEVDTLHDADAAHDEATCPICRDGLPHEGEPTPYRPPPGPIMRLFALLALLVIFAVLTMMVVVSIRGGWPITPRRCRRESND